MLLSKISLISIERPCLLFTSKPLCCAYNNQSFTVNKSIEVLFGSIPFTNVIASFAISFSLVPTLPCTIERGITFLFLFLKFILPSLILILCSSPTHNELSDKNKCRTLYSAEPIS